MKILFCNFEYPPLGGGGGVITASLAEELAKRHNVVVLTSQALGLPSESIESGVRIVRVPVFFRRRRESANFPSMLAYLPLGVLGVRKLRRKENFDIVNTHFVLPTGPVGQVAARMWGIPNVLSVHGGDLYDPSKRSSPHRHWFLRHTIKYLVSSADTVVAQSSDTHANLRRFFAPDATATIIPLGIPRRPIVETSREKFGFDDTDILLVTVGRLVGRKSIDQLIDIVADLNNSSLKLVVVGSGSLRGSLEARAKQKSVGSRVVFMGEVSEIDKQELLSLADLFVSTSQHEGFGLVYLEAMAAGLPVICYDRGGQTDFLDDKMTGYVVALNEKRTFVERCRELINSPERRAVMGDENKRRIETYYIDHCAYQYESLFESILRRNSGRGSKSLGL